jgi:serine/threonine protein kinase
MRFFVCVCIARTTPNDDNTLATPSLPLPATIPSSETTPLPIEVATPSSSTPLLTPSQQSSSSVSVLSSHPSQQPPVPFSVPRTGSRSALKKASARPALAGIADSMVNSGSGDDIASAAAVATLPTIPVGRFVPDPIPKGSFRGGVHRTPASATPNLAAPTFVPVPMPLSSNAPSISVSSSISGGGSGVLHSQSHRVEFKESLVDIKEEKSTLSSFAGSQAGSMVGFKSQSSSSMKSASFVLRDTASKNVIAANTVYKLIEKNGPHKNLQNVAYLRPGDFFYPDQDNDDEEDEHTTMAAQAAAITGSPTPIASTPVREASKELGLVFEPHQGDMEEWLRQRRYRLERCMDMMNRRKYRESALKNHQRRSAVNLNEPLPDQPPFPPSPDPPYLTQQEAQHLAFQLVSGLVELHDLGVIHRGLSPQSVLLFQVPNPPLAPYYSPEHPLFYSLDGSPSNITFKIGDYIWARRKKHGANASSAIPKGSDDEYKLYCASRQFTSLYLPPVTQAGTAGAPPGMAGSAVFGGPPPPHDPTVPLEYHNDVYSIGMILYAAMSLDDMSTRGTPVSGAASADGESDETRTQRTTIDTSNDEKARGIRERGALGKSHRDMMSIGTTAAAASAAGPPSIAGAGLNGGGIASPSMAQSFAQSPSFHQRPSRMVRKRKLIASKLRDINGELYKRYGELTMIVADMIENNLGVDITKGSESRVALDRIAQLDYVDNETRRSCNDQRILRVSFLDDQKLTADVSAQLTNLSISSLQSPDCIVFIHIA